MIRNRHSDTVQTMAQGVLELKESHPVDQQTENSIQYFLDRLYMSRISIRMLINQHSKTEFFLPSGFELILCEWCVAAMLFGTDLNVTSNSRHVGCIDPSCDIVGVVRDAYENARFLCDQYYLASPELELFEHNGNGKM
jgi:pyruvate dehydrogenase kinase 2/3/4